MLLSPTGANPTNRCRKGFTLVELMVTISLVAILTTLGFPTLRSWVRNSQVRTVADAVQNGLRVAQTEAVRRNRQTVFSLTNDLPGQTSTATASGKNWALHSVVRGDDDPNATFLQGGTFSDTSPNVSINSNVTAVCFNSAGRLAVPAAGTGVTGAVCTLTPPSLAVSATGSDRNLNITVSINGQVRMCDPSKTLSATTPDGC